MLSNLTLKFYANTFVKVDAQIEEECRRTISYLKGWSCLKLYCKKLSNRNPRRVQLALQEEQLYGLGCLCSKSLPRGRATTSVQLVASLAMHRTSDCQQRERCYYISLQLPLKNALPPKAEKLFVF